MQAIQQAQFTNALFQPYVILASSQAQETSKEDAEKGGLFTHFLLQGMGDEATHTCPACDPTYDRLPLRAWLTWAGDGVQANAFQKPQLMGNVASANLWAIPIPWFKPKPRPVVTPIVPSQAPTRPVTIVLKLNVSEADVAVNGVAVQSGVGPEVVLENKPAGAYRIEVSKPGYLPRTVRVTLSEGERTRLVVNLEPRPAPVGKLFITTDPPHAHVQIGGQAYTSPVTGLSLGPGSYHVAVGKPGYQRLDEWVTVEAGKENRYSYQLEPIPRPTPTPVVVHTPRPTRTLTGVPPGHFQFVRIQAGTFLMGSPTSEPERDRNETQHQVTISRSFEMQTTEVTQALWQAVMGNNPSYFKGANLPVEQVSWDDVQTFISKLNQLLGTTVYRLPTEAEWEYVARAGTTTPFWTGHNLTMDQANYYSQGQYRGKTTPVKTFAANPWGLYDMHGNVEEGVQDWYGSYLAESVVDPTGPTTGSARVFRGGLWSDGARFCRSASRSGHSPGYGDAVLGFRLAKSPSP